MIHGCFASVPGFFVFSSFMNLMVITFLFLFML